MTVPVNAAPFARLARKIAPDSTLLRAWTLHGGISAQVTAIELEGADGRQEKWVVRQHGTVDLARNPNIAADEFRLLRLLHDAGIPVPRPVALDASGEIFATPVVVVSFIEGESVFSLADVPAFIPQFAAHLARIHRIDCAAYDLSFLPRQEALWATRLRTRPAHRDESLDAGRIRDTLAAAWPLPWRNAPGLLHGDYWPGNILWRDKRLVGVIDWEDAATGDPLADVANSRLELLWAFGANAMERFTEHYTEHYVAATSSDALDITDLPYWDLCAALRHIPHVSTIASNAVEEARLREQHRLFVAQAFARLTRPRKQAT